MAIDASPEIGATALQRAIERSAPLGISVLDLTGRQIHVNPAFCRMVGWPAEVLVGALPPFRYWPPEHAAAHRESLRVILGGGALPAAGLERLYQRRSGEKFPVHMTVAPLLDDSGERIGIIGIIADTSYQGVLEAEATRLRTAVEASGEAIFMTGRDGTFTFINPEFTRLYGYTHDEVVGRATPRILKSDTLSQDEYEAFWKKLLAGQVVRWEITNKTKGGALVRIDSSANPVLDARGEIVGFLAIQRDVTESRTIEEQLRRSAEELRKSESRFARLAETGLVAIGLCDLQGQISEVNDAFLAMFGYSRAEVLAGLSFLDMTPPDWKWSDDKAIESVKRTGVAPPREKEMFRKDGSRVQVLAGVALLDPTQIIDSSRNGRRAVSDQRGRAKLCRKRLEKPALPMRSRRWPLGARTFPHTSPTSSPS